MGVSPFGFAPFSLSGYGCGVTNFVTTLDTCYLSRCCFRLCFLRIRIVNCSPNQFGYRSAGLFAFFLQPVHLPRQQAEVGSVHLHKANATRCVTWCQGLFGDSLRSRTDAAIRSASDSASDLRHSSNWLPLLAPSRYGWRGQ